MSRKKTSPARFLLIGSLVLYSGLATAADFCEIDFSKRVEAKTKQVELAERARWQKVYHADTAQEFVDAYFEAYPEDALLKGKPLFDFAKNEGVFPARAIDTWVNTFMKERSPHEPLIYKYFPDRSYIIRKKEDGTDYRGMNMQHASFLVVGGLVRQMSVELNKIKMAVQQRHKSGIDKTYADLSAQLRSKDDYAVKTAIRETTWQIQDTQGRLNRVSNIDDVPVLQGRLRDLETQMTALKLIQNERIYRSYLIAATSRLERLVKDHFAEEEAMLRRRAKESWNLPENLQKHFAEHDKMEEGLLALTRGASSISNSPEEISAFGTRLYTGLSAWLNLHIKVYDNIEYNRPSAK